MVELFFYKDVTLPEASASAYSAISAHITNPKFLLGSDSLTEVDFNKLLHYLCESEARVSDIPSLLL